MLGATGPVTLGGSLVLQNAEDLAMNAIIQLSSPKLAGNLWRSMRAD